LVLGLVTFITLVTVIGALHGQRVGTSEITDDHAANLDLDAFADSLITEIAHVPETDAEAIDGPPALPFAASAVDLVIDNNLTFYESMRGLGASHSDIMALVSACKPFRNLGKIHDGDSFTLHQDAEGQVHRMSFDLEDQESYIVFARNDEDRFDIYQLTYPVEHRICAVAGQIDISLYESLKDIQAPPALATKMNDILGWDIDFRRDVRTGDSFSIIYEEIYRDEVFVRTGPIIALQYTNRNGRHVGFRHTGADGVTGYYDTNGHNLEKQLMRAPVEYSRISSGFTHRRFHPVHKRWMPHYGVDYAAPVGTPVRAAGNGVIADARFNRNNGRFVSVRHNNRSYQTYYLHLSRFAKGIRKGVKVKRGQIIGYVGATGVATGPHLDYRIKKDGEWVNPRNLKLPPSEPLPASELPAFRAELALYSYCMAAQPQVCMPHKVDPSRPLTPPWQVFLPSAEQELILVANRLGN
jgi:murein DD-endopeptidase MepM/ murein hydrolase activator NlpD